MFTADRSFNLNALRCWCWQSLCLAQVAFLSHYLLLLLFGYFWYFLFQFRGGGSYVFQISKYNLFHFFFYSFKLSFRWRSWLNELCLLHYFCVLKTGCIRYINIFIRIIHFVWDVSKFWYILYIIDAHNSLSLLGIDPQAQYWFRKNQKIRK